MKKLAVLAMAAALAGCATQRFDVNSADDMPPSYDHAQLFFVGGVGQDREVDAGRVCGGGRNVQRVETQLTAANVGMAVLTFGIYTPRQIRVYCTR
jgi:Bor protein